jgi:DNA-binding transcriptional regulator YbjK
MGYAAVTEDRPQRTQTRDRDVTVPAILAAAEIEFATNGFVATRTESIAARANVVKGLIFHYFKSKEGLFSRGRTNRSAGHSTSPLTQDFAQRTRC